MEWNKLLSAKRLEGESRPSTRGRTAFEADVDRIAFSAAFRRLNRKTQVHPLAANDHVHSRLTHSVEVSRVGRTLGRAIGFQIARELPGDMTPADIGAIVEAACLAHDIGNPPFGHAGEEAIEHWFEENGARFFGSLSRPHKRDLMVFEGNAQGFRVITQLENHLFRGGLRLTYATLGAFLKYPWTSRRTSHRRFGAYLAEEPILAKVADELGLVPLEKGAWCRHPLAHAVEAADDICYGVIDLEDCVELGIMPYEKAESCLLSVLSAKAAETVKGTFRPTDGHRIKLARLRGPVVESLVEGTIEAFKSNYDSIMEGKVEKDLLLKLADDDPRRGFFGEAETQRRRFADKDPRKVETELGSYATFDCLLDAFCKAAVDAAQHLKHKDESALIWKSERVLDLLGDHAPSPDNAPPGTSWSPYQCLRRVIDFVSGMTDGYATYIAKQLQGGAFTGRQRP